MSTISHQRSFCSEKATYEWTERINNSNELGLASSNKERKALDSPCYSVEHRISALIAATVGQYCNRPQDMIPLLKKSMRLCPIYSAWYAEALSWAYLLMSQQHDAIATAQDAVRIDPDYIYSYMVLAVAYAELGRREDAGGAVENILRIAPHYTLRTFAETQPFRDAEVLQRHLDSLRKAGLPE